MNQMLSATNNDRPTSIPVGARQINVVDVFPRTNCAKVAEERGKDRFRAEADGRRIANSNESRARIHRQHWGTFAAPRLRGSVAFGPFGPFAIEFGASCIDFFD
jgi:hypothetical protein